MTIQIGAKLHSLRKKADVTQDRLAEYLGVTAQAISRWEGEKCYPDIEILPAIADFFNISLDELLGVDQQQKARKIEAVITRAQQAQEAGRFAEAISVYREALAQFPSSHRLQALLAAAIGCIDNGEKISPEAANETIGLCRRILEDCVDDELRYHALLIQCWVHARQLDDEDKAMALVAKLPPVYGCQEFVQAETLRIRLPDKRAEPFLFSLMSAMLITFDRPDVTYSNDKTARLEALIGELSAMLARTKEGEYACPTDAVFRKPLA
ncbi:MAG: helix-turn-helix domain-containing protein [Oscillospiraceae bacterium]|jgi:transcriptional regulator with XRE-family HTH domain|nr:helix-turn-helix domain-containing protein [Oscillospiraceae bacterium]